jgi:pimeloyl-ACP methyl ester carboxylesterase
VIVNVGQARVYVVDEGQGAPTLFLHGNPDSSDVWRGLIDRLAPHVRCLAPDLPGLGRSSAPAGFDCSLDGMAGFVDGLLGALGIDGPVNLVVHDVGGPYGLAWAVKHPGRVRSLVIMNTMFFSDYRWHRLGRLWRLPLVGELVQALTTRRGFVREMRRGSRRLGREHIHRAYDLVTPAMTRMVLRWYRANDPANYRGWEDRFVALTARVPSLVLWGVHDPYIGLAFSHRFGAAAVEHFPDCGHWLPAEAPDEVARRLLAFLHEEAARPEAAAAAA